MKAFFDLITRLSLRFRAITLLSIVVVMALGGIAGAQLKQELLPPIEFPQTYILAEVSGLSSEQVLTLVTTRLEKEIGTIPEIVNLTSTSTGAIGAIITAANDFGLDQAKLREEVQAAIDTVWFPSRQIAPPTGEDAKAFGMARVSEITPELAIYWAQNSDTFAFQLSADVWALLPDETLNALLSYLANQTSTDSADQSALEKLVAQELVPQIQTLPQIANVSIDGGQALPGEETAFVAEATDAGNKSYLLQLSPLVWEVIQSRVPSAQALDQNAVEAFSQLDYPIVTVAPELPLDWQALHFQTADDILEMQSLTKTVARIVNDFAATGVIRGPLGQTNDLTVETVEQMLAIDLTLINTFSPEQLAALPSDVFGALPTEYLESLDGITKDTLAAAAIARSLSGNESEYAVPLPTAWQIQPPQIITFSLASLPLATFSIFNTQEAVAPTTGIIVELTPEATVDPIVELPEGPALPQLFSVFGEVLGAELDTADDLALITLSDVRAAQFGVSSFKGSDLLNSLASGGFEIPSGDAAGADAVTIDIPTFVQSLPECGFGLLDIDIQNPDIAKILIGCIKPDTVQYFLDNEPSFVSSLSPAVYNYFTSDVLALPGIRVPLSDVWNSIRTQPVFGDISLTTNADLVALAEGDVAKLLNTINSSVPSQFAGYEVRLIDSLSVAGVNEILRTQPDFFSKLDADVLLKLSASVLQLVESDSVTQLNAEQLAQLEAIKSGEQASAAQTMADANATIVSDLPPTDPDAPALDASWSRIVSNTPGVDQLKNASDLLRLPPNYGGAAAFIKTIFDFSTDFGRQIVGTLSIEALEYIAERDTTFLEMLDVRALKALTPDVLAALPQDIQDRAASGDVFIPTSSITRTNGASSLLLTVSKDQEANTIEAYYAVKELLDRIDQENPNIAVAVAFEQSGLVEESISGVVREGALGAFFAVLIILVFLSGGYWNLQGRRITGTVVLVLAVAFLALVIGSQLGAHDGLQAAWEHADAVLRVIGMGGIVVGIGLLTLRSNLAHPAWRSTLVIAVSIPLSIFAALVLMKWLPPAMNQVLLPLADTSPIFAFLLRLAPKELTLNIMTLSGLTVAVGRVVDDSIVVLENIFRQIQVGNLSKRDAILTGTRDVSVAIFSATGITVVVFLPLGLTGGLIGEFFLPFGLAVTYALLASFVVAITVIPVLVEMFVTEEEAHEEPEGGMQHFYVEVLRWVLGSNGRKVLVIVLAVLSAGIGVLLFGTRPQAFIPDFGDPQISIAIELPAGTPILETDKVARQAEDIVRTTVDAEQLETLSTNVGGGGLSIASLIGGSSISENRATITIGLESSEILDEYTREIREAVEAELGSEIATVSKATLTSSGGFGGFELVMSGNDQNQLFELEPCIVKALNDVEGVANVSSNLAQTGLGGGSCPTLEFTIAVISPLTAEQITTLKQEIATSVVPAKLIVQTKESNDSGVFGVSVSALDLATITDNQTKIEDVLKRNSPDNQVQVSALDESNESPSSGENTSSAVYLRINQQPALSFTGQVETEDTINLAGRAIRAIEEQIDLPEGVIVGQGYNSEFQQEGFSGIFVAMGIAIVIVVLILILVFGSPVYWFAVIFSIMVAPVGAAIALTITSRTLGISALIGLLMLLGLVVTNAVVLIDRVSSNRHERKMLVKEALLEAGGRRLRPILMTALATIIALLPLALGLSEGALIAEELGTVVIGGLLSSTLLTLVVVPAVYSLTTPLHNFFIRRDKATLDT